MRAASEWSRIVDEAFARGIQQRTAPGFFIGRLRQAPPPGRAQRRSRDERLARGEHRRATRQLELAAFGSPDAVALHGALIEFRVDRAGGAHGGLRRIVCEWLHGRTELRRTRFAKRCAIDLRRAPRAAVFPARAISRMRARCGSQTRKPAPAAASAAGRDRCASWRQRSAVRRNRA